MDVKETLEELQQSQNNTFEHLKSIDELSFGLATSDLSQTTLLEEGRLWVHQKEALMLVLAYLSSNPVSDRKRAALVKMPTGTGKTAIVAALSRCLPNIRRVLIVTPRESLVRQMCVDLAHRFWNRFDFTPTNEAGEELEIDYGPLYSSPFIHQASNLTGPNASIEFCQILQLLPRTSRNMFLKIQQSESRFAAVCTFNSLHTIFSTDRDLWETIKSSVDLLIVDEGHYEPAAKWQIAIRDLSLPAVLLSATPYRNDFRAFNIDTDFVFNFPFPSATGTQQDLDKSESNSQPIIRTVAFEPLPGQSRSGAYGKTFAQRLVDFYDSTLPRKCNCPQNYKVIIRSNVFDRLISIKNHLIKLGRKAVVIHDRIPLRKREAQAKSEFHSYSQVREHDYEFWLHDSKLMEGVDDPSFVAVVVID